MTDKDIKKIIDQGSKEFKEKAKKEKFKYVLNFGEISIQYEFSLN